MILQPISGLKPEESLANINTKEGFNSLDILKKAIELEKDSYRFYMDASGKAKLILAEASRYFEKFADENNVRSQKLTDLTYCYIDKTSQKFRERRDTN